MESVKCARCHLRTPIEGRVHCGPCLKRARSDGEIQNALRSSDHRRKAARIERRGRG
jgi:hypothetical protein